MVNNDTDPNSSAKRRRLNPEARRVELLEAALRVLKHRGPLDTRVKDVTEAAGAAKGTFYRYFSSWEDLLEHIRDHLLRQYVGEIRERFPAAARTDWWAAFRQECIEFLRFHEVLGELHEAVFHGPIVQHPVDPAFSAEAILGWLLRTGIESGACRRVDVEVSSRVLFSLLHSVADNIDTTGEHQRNIDTLLDLLQAWLRAPGAPESRRESALRSDPSHAADE